MGAAVPAVTTPQTAFTLVHSRWVIHRPHCLLAVLSFRKPSVLAEPFD